MEINKQNLKQSIKALLKDVKFDDALDLVLGEMSDLELQTVIQVILDPEYHSKQAALTDPKRFITKEALQESLKREEQQKREQRMKLQGMYEMSKAQEENIPHVPNDKDIITNPTCLTPTELLEKTEPMITRKSIQTSSAKLADLIKE